MSGDARSSGSGTGRRLDGRRGGRRASDDNRPLVVASVGTDVHPFDRMVGWVDAWAAAHPDVLVIVQRGNSEATTTAESESLLAHTELCRLFGIAVAVVSHGGPSTVMDARAAGRLPIVVPRDPALGEHVDDHQLRFARHLDRHGLARLVDDGDALTAHLDRALTEPAAYAVDTGDEAIAGVVAFGRVVDDLLVPATPRSAHRVPRAQTRRTVGP